MSQTTNSVTIGSVTPKQYWTASVFSNDVNPSSANLVVKAEPSSGDLYLEHIMIFCNATSATINVLDDTAVVIGPFLTTTAEMTGVYDIKLLRPIKFSGAINVTAGADSDIYVLAEGFTG